MSENHRHPSTNNNHIPQPQTVPSAEPSAEPSAVPSTEQARATAVPASTQTGPGESHDSQSPEAESPSLGSTLVNEPIFNITVGVFALLTTAFPAAMAQFRFMPIVQAIALTVFLTMAVRRGNFRAGYTVMGLWIFVQFTTLLVITLLLPATVQRAIADGFNHRQGLLEWIYGAALYPSGLLANPGAYLTEFAGVLIGGVATAGLLGSWFLMRLINLTAYSIGALTLITEGPFAAVIPLLLWHILRIAGYACLLPILAMPALSGIWSPRYYWQNHRRPLLIGLGLIVAALLFEAILAPLWPGFMPEY